MIVFIKVAMALFVTVGILQGVLMNMIYSHLEVHHQKKLKQMELPVRFWFLWYSSPIRSVNWFRFVFGTKDFHDESLRRKKNLYRAATLALCIVIVCIMVVGVTGSEAW